MVACCGFCAVLNRAFRLHWEGLSGLLFFSSPELGHTPRALWETLGRALLLQDAAMSDAGSGSLLDALGTDVTGLHTTSALGLRRLLCARPRLFNGIFIGVFIFVPRRSLCTSMACRCDQSLNQG